MRVIPISKRRGVGRNQSNLIQGRRRTTRKAFSGDEALCKQGLAFHSSRKTEAVESGETFIFFFFRERPPFPMPGVGEFRRMRRMGTFQMGLTEREPRNKLSNRSSAVQEW